MMYRVDYLSNVAKQGYRTSETLEKVIIATSNNATMSRCMPWELGYLDGEKGKAAIFPVLERVETRFNRDGYLEVYPVCWR